MYRVFVARKTRRRDGHRVRVFGEGEGWTRRQAISFANGKRAQIGQEKNLSTEKVTIFRHPKDHHVYVVTE